MPKLHQIIERHWQCPSLFLSFPLKPSSRLFAKIAAKRRDDFVSGCLKSEKLPAFVVMVGSIHVGGTRKMSIVAVLVSGSQEKGVKVGTISWGYGCENEAVHVLNAESRAEDAGDEPLLLFRETGVPTTAGNDRTKAGRVLLTAYPGIGLIVTDDGLQYYALRHDMEIVVFPSADARWTDLDLPPNGSLHEPLLHLDSTDVVVVSGDKADAPFAPSENTLHSHVETGQIHRLNQPPEILDTGRLKKQAVTAIVGIAKPERFSDPLRSMDITLNQTIALPDHADIAATDLPDVDMVIITEKDTIRFSDGLNLNRIWVLPACAIVRPDLTEFVLERLEDVSQVV